jgi:hypothetical protein
MNKYVNFCASIHFSDLLIELILNTIREILKNVCKSFFLPFHCWQSHDAGQACTTVIPKSNELLPYCNLKTGRKYQVNRKFSFHKYTALRCLKNEAAWPWDVTKAKKKKKGHKTLIMFPNRVYGFYIDIWWLMTAAAPWTNNSWQFAPIPNVMDDGG